MYLCEIGVNCLGNCISKKEQNVEILRKVKNVLMLNDINLALRTILNQNAAFSVFGVSKPFYYLTILSIQIKNKRLTIAELSFDIFFNCFQFTHRGIGSNAKYKDQKYYLCL